MEPREPDGADKVKRIILFTDSDDRGVWQDLLDEHGVPHQSLNAKRFLAGAVVRLPAIQTTANLYEGAENVIRFALNYSRFPEDES